MQANRKKASMMRKLIALLMALCMVLGTAVPVLAKNGPSSGETSAAWVQLYNNNASYVLYSNGGKKNTVKGAVYNKSTNTITLTNYNHPELILATNEMGDDLKLKLVGKNHINSLVVWGFGWGGNLEIIGNGSLTINKNKTAKPAAIRFMAEGTKGILKVGPNATVTAYKSAGKDNYSAAFISTTSATLPFKGNIQTKLSLTSGSGVEQKVLEQKRVIAEGSAGRSFDILEKSGDKGMYAIGDYGTQYTGGDWTNGVPVASIYKLIKADGLPSGNEYLAVKVETVKNIKDYEIPAGYSTTSKGLYANKADLLSATVLKKDGKTFYWLQDKNSSGYSVYKTAMTNVTTEDWGEKIKTNIVVPVGGASNSGDNAKAIPKAYKTNMIKTGMYSYQCTNDTIKVVPGIAANLKINTNSIKITWNKRSSAKGYVIYKKTGNGSFKKLATLNGASKTSYTDKNVKSGKKYSYKLRSFNGGNYSPYSKVVTSIYLKAQKPAVKKVSNGIKISYKKIEGANGYQIYRKAVNGQWTKIKTINKAGAGSFIDTKAKKGTYYQYMVKAKAGYYYSAYIASEKVKR